MDASQLSQLTDRRFSSLNRDLSPSCIGTTSHGLRPSPPSKKRRYNPINDHYSQNKRRLQLSIERNGGANNHAADL